jgi:drug/metabolite transporter (DMT)-like permease
VSAAADFWHNARLMKNHRATAVFALLVSILSWGSVPLFLRHFTSYLDAWTVNGVRYAVAALLLAPTLLWQGGGPRRIPWRDALVPACINAVGQVGWALIPYFATASVMGFGVRASFLFTLAGSLWLLPEERSLLRAPLFWAGSALCIGGVAGLFSGALRDATASAGGLVILLATSAVWGFYGVTVRKFLRGYAPQHSFGVISLYTASIVVLLMLILGHPGRLVRLEIGVVLLLVLSALLGIALAHVLMIYVLHHLGPVIESGAEMLTPFLTFCGAALIFGERLSMLQWLGGIGVVAGCGLMLAVHRPQPEFAVSTDGLGID